MAGMGRSERISPASGEAVEHYYSFFDHAKYVEAFISALDLGDLTLITHDWGTAIGFHYFAQHPNNVRAIVFMEALIQPFPSWAEFPRAGSPPELGRFFAFLRSPQGRGQLVDHPTFFYDAMIAPLTGRQLLKPERRSYLGAAPDRNSRIVFWRWVSQLPVAGEPAGVTEAVYRYSDSLEKSDVPKLLIYHPMGVITTDFEADWVKNHWTNVTVVRLSQQSGGPVHFLQEAFPEAVCAALLDWLGKLP
jgi:haloalkane dehalogenase